MPEEREPNNDEVICPHCTHQFRAIPINVQTQLGLLEEQHEKDEHLTEHMWHRVMKQLDMIEEREQVLDFIRRSAQAAIDDPHSQNALFAEPIVEKVNRVLGEEE